MSLFSSSKKKIYYPSGELMSSYVSDKDGNPKGRYTEYFKNGIVEAEGKIISGRKEGNWNFYKENGSIQAKGEFIGGYKIDNWRYDLEGMPKSISWSIYKQPDELFGINFPTLWKIEKSNEKVLVAIFENNGSRNEYWNNINIFRCEIDDDNVSIPSYIGEFIKYQIKDSPKPIQIESELSEKFVINGLDSYSSVMKTTNLSNQPIIFFQFYIQKERTLFVINFFALEIRLDEVKKIYQEIVFSFKSPY